MLSLLVQAFLSDPAGSYSLQALQLPSLLSRLVQVFLTDPTDSPGTFSVETALFAPADHPSILCQILLYLSVLAFWLSSLSARGVAGWLAGAGCVLVGSDGVTGLSAFSVPV